MCCVRQEERKGPLVRRRVGRDVPDAGSARLPGRLRVLGEGDEVHDGDVDEAAGVGDDGQDGREVVCAAACRDLGRRALEGNGYRDNRMRDVNAGMQLVCEPLWGCCTKAH